MHCWRSDQQGGINWQADVNTIAARADAGLIERLQQVRYPMPLGWGYVLRRTPQGAWLIASIAATCMALPSSAKHN